MKIRIVADAWVPQVNGVVTTLVELQQGLLARVHDVVIVEPSAFARVTCPGHREIQLAWRPARGVRDALKQARSDAIHITSGQGVASWPLSALARHSDRVAGSSPRPAPVPKRSPSEQAGADETF